MGVDNSVIPPGTYVKVSGNLRSFQVRTCVQLMKTSIKVLFYMRLSLSVNGIVALFNYSNIIPCALCRLSNDIFILLHAIKITVYIPLLETVSEQPSCTI